MYKVVFPLISLILTAACGTSVPAEGLVFDPSSGKEGSIELPTGETVNYTAYEKLYFVTNVEDPTYQYMNVYVPDYLNYVVSTQPLKGVPSFDSKGVLGSRASGENEEFGDATGSSVNFTEYGAAANGVALGDEIKHRVFLMNPMDFICNPKATNAPHWYVRYDARNYHLVLNMDNLTEDKAVELILKYIS